MNQQQIEVQKFLLLTKGQYGKALEANILHLVTQNFYQYTEFLQLPNVKELINNPSSKQSYELLQLFAYHNYKYWLAHKQQYPQLNQQQIKKLKLLSLIDLCSKDKAVSYNAIKQELDIENDKDVESIVIESIYSGIITAKISQEERVIRISHCISRDISLSLIHI
eukprot:TRINITY_DN2966_c0_g1_i7.p1 TRINITY_DN2966_c0_g1~~TRINITY_DN2966_c0_g1_i7.p1  ORF type:complete len:166 (+),score=19.78 TRINITY_DN2966_c0_g1_i7:138-635(+)